MKFIWWTNGDNSCGESPRSGEITVEFSFEAYAEESEYFAELMKETIRKVFDLRGTDNVYTDEEFSRMEDAAIAHEEMINEGLRR